MHVMQVIFTIYCILLGFILAVFFIFILFHFCFAFCEMAEWILRLGPFRNALVINAFLLMNQLVINQSIIVKIKKSNCSWDKKKTYYGEQNWN